jgi:hypothetical protein
MDFKIGKLTITFENTDEHEQKHISSGINFHSDMSEKIRVLAPLGAKYLKHRVIKFIKHLK